MAKPDTSQGENVEQRGTAATISPLNLQILGQIHDRVQRLAPC